MIRALRFALIVVGLAISVYGVASITGGWLGTPSWWEPWWEQVTEREWHEGPVVYARGYAPVAARPGIGVGVAVAGLLLATICAWPRRKQGGA